MGNGTVKTIVMLMVLVVLSFIVGAQVSDNVKDSIGAFAIIGVVVGGGFLVYMGPKVWQLLFILPPFVEILPISYLGHAIKPCGFAPVAVASVVMVYWVVQWSLGRVRIRWRWAAVLDIPFLVLVLLLVAAYVRDPVVINALGLDYDGIGGEEIIVLYFVLLSYLAFSSIPISEAELEKCLPLSFKLFFVASVLYIIRSVFLGDGELGLGDHRVYIFYPMASALFFWAFSKYPVLLMLGKWRCWLAVVYCAVATLLTGQRQNMAMLAAGVLFIAFIKRELIVLILAVMGLYLGLLYMGEMDLLSALPRSIQRAASIAPGVKVSAAVSKDGTGTVNLRYEIWACALDPKSGVIKNLMWGDGYGVSRAYLLRNRVSGMRGTSLGTSDLVAMGISRNFHNGAIHTISRIGYVGLAWCAVVCIVFWCVSIQVLRAWHHSGAYPYIVVGLMSIPIIFLTYGFCNYTTKDFLFALHSYFFLKLCYCIAREKGSLRPLFAPQRYVPLIIQETEKKLAVPAGALAA